MRTALLAGVLASAAFALAACGNADTTSSLANRRHSASPPAEGSDEQHDPNDVEDGDGTPNPNADTPAPPPDSQGSTTGEIAATLSTATPTVDIGKSIDVTVTVEPKSGFKGDADLTVTGLPKDVTATFSPAKLTFPEGSTAAMTSKLTIVTTMQSVPTAPNATTPIVISAKQGTVEAKANANFKIAPKFTMTIPLNIDALRAAVGTRYIDGWGGANFGTAPKPLYTQTGNGFEVTVINNDTVPHIVHGANGFAHGDTGNPVPPGGTDPKKRTLSPGVNCNGYLHEGTNGPSVSFRIQVMTAP